MGDVTRIERTDDTSVVPRSSGQVTRPTVRRLEFEDCHVAQAISPNYSDKNDPLDRIEALNSTYSAEWQAAMDMEIESLKCNRTFSEVDLPSGRNAVKSKWVFKRKTHPDVSLDKFKARIVAKRFSQRPGEDFFATFSPVVRHATLCLWSLSLYQRNGTEFSSISKVHS